MEVQFREVNPFDLWIWLEFETNPSPAEQQYIEELFSSWFYIGKLGGFNAENLQVQDTGVELSDLDYESAHLSRSLMAPMHNMADFQYQDHWGRCWFDLGTSDLIALDVLINSLYQLSLDYVPVRRLIVGGINEDWPIVDRDDERFDQFDQN